MGAGREWLGGYFRPDYNDRSEQDILRSEVLDEFTDEIIDLYHAIKKEKDSFAELGIDFEEKAFYDILKALTIKYDFKYPEDKLLDLAENGYPPIDRDEVNKEIFEQAENFKKYQSVTSG